MERLFLKSIKNFFPFLISKYEIKKEKDGKKQDSTIIE